jgi:translation initiation factor IF-3
MPLPLPENSNRARVNDKIRVPTVRLIDEEGQQVGIIAIHEALNKAQAAGMDLVEVSPDAKPPVCRIQDYSKFLFEQQKKDRAAKANAHKSETGGLVVVSHQHRGVRYLEVCNARAV